MEAATRMQIKNWIDNRPSGTTHMLVVCDTFDYVDYPVYYPSESTKAAKDVTEVYRNYNDSNMQRVMEVYSFTGVHSIETQLGEFRAFHFD
jgi:hypothetical protein